MVAPAAADSGVPWGAGTIVAASESLGEANAARGILLALVAPPEPAPALLLLLPTAPVSPPRACAVSPPRT